jgi:hypothetical protein
MAMINGTEFNGNNTVNGNGKFHKFLVGAIALQLLILIGLSLETVITAPALALTTNDGMHTDKRGNKAVWPWW